MSTTDKLKETFAKPIVVGLVSALGSKALGNGQSFNVALPILGEVNSMVFYGLLGLGSSLATETLHQWVLPLLPQSGQAVQIENAILSPVIHAAVNVGVLSLGWPSVIKEFGYSNPIMLGVGAELAGSYAYLNFVKVML